LEGRVGVFGDLVGVIVEVTCVIGVAFLVEKENGCCDGDVVAVGVKGAGAEMTGVGVMGVVMGRAEGEDNVGKGMIGVGVIVEVTCVMGLGGDCELWDRLWLLVKISWGDSEVDGYWIKGPEGGAVVEVKDVQLLDGAAKLFKKELKPLLLLLLKALLFVFAMAAFASALAVREDGLKAPPASAEVSALLAGRGDAVGMMGVMWAVALAPARLLKL
jgi:hypothetical protein